MISMDDGERGQSDLITHLADEGLSQSERLIRLERFKVLHRAIAELSPKQQAVVCLHYFENLSLKEIAHITRSNVGLVKWRLYQSRKKLAQLIGEQTEKEGSYHET